MCAPSYRLSGSRRVSGPWLGGAAALRYRHTETHIFAAANLAPGVSRYPQTSFGKTEMKDVL